MYATAAFDFNQADNGWLMAGNSFMRAVFLIFIFPRIISLGRRWFASHAKKESIKKPDAGAEVDRQILPTEPEEFEAPTGTQAEEEPVSAEPAEEKAAYEFDLFFLRWSLVVDGVLTAATAFATKGWHVYLGKRPCCFCCVAPGG